MIYGSVCSGIEAATVAWHPLGWRASFFSEIDNFPRAVLAHHYPDTPLHGDFTTIKAGDYAAIDVLVGGTPCQSFSVAGLRAGLADPRGNLMLEFGALAARLAPRWVVWENVPGVLSSNGGRDFGTFLGMLAELGYGFAYRVLDAQFFGVPQRRRRVFVVGCLGDWRRAAAVLFERHSLLGHPAPRRQAGQTVTPTIRAGAANGGAGHGARSGDSKDELIVPVTMAHGQGGAEIGFDRGPTLTCNHEAPIVAHTLRGQGFDASKDGTGRGTPLVPVIGCDNYNGRLTGDVAATLSTHSGNGVSAEPSVMVPMAFSAGDSGNDIGMDVAPTVRKGGDGGGNQVAVAFAHQGGGTQTTLGYDETSDVTQTLSANQTPAVAIRTANTGANGHGIAEDVAHTLDRAQGQAVAYPLDTQNCSPGHNSGGKGFGEAGDPAFTLTKAHSHAVAFAQNTRDEVRLQGGDGQVCGALSADPGMKQTTYVACPPLTASNNPSRSPQSSEVTQQVAAVHQAAMQVRRLTPRECERLQGFPDDYTLIPVRGKPAADGPRYKALGNSMAVPVMAWIGRRIAQVDAIPASANEQAA